MKGQLKDEREVVGNELWATKGTARNPDWSDMKEYEGK